MRTEESFHDQSSRWMTYFWPTAFSQKNTCVVVGSGPVPLVPGDKQWYM